MYRCRRDRGGQVVAVVSMTAPWSPRAADDVIADIESGRYRYLVDWGHGPRALVITGDGPGARLDAAGPDGPSGGLDALPHG